MFKRTITSIILILITVTTIFFLPPFCFAVVLAIFIGLGLYEFFRMVSQKNLISQFKNFAICAGISVPFLNYFGFLSRIKGWELLFFVVLIFLFFVIQFTRKENQNAALSIALSFFGLFYVSILFNFLLKLRLLENGPRLVAYLLLVTKSGDMGAYIIGVNLGRHKIIPRISPNKSIEGAVGGFIFSLIAAFLMGFYLTTLGFVPIITTGILLGIFAQLGDLAESAIKRDYAVKDSGPFVPGLGGILDLIDSILFTAPLFYYYLTWLG